MGGNVFTDYLNQKDQTFVGRRLETEDYPSALYAVKAILDKIGVSYVTIDFVREKESHGDLDILVERHKDISVHDITTILLNEGFKVSQNSTHIISFLLLTFQVDLIFIDSDSIDYARNYFSWNDLGNLIGRISKQVGLQHGHDGLYYIQRSDDTRVLKKHKLSTDYLDILTILELDIPKFKQGFDTYVEMFQWVSASPYFIPSLFSFENLNNRNRVRDRKRVIYNMFLNWISTQEFNKQPRIIEDKLAFISKFYPDLKSDCEKVDIAANQLKLLRAKLDINFIMDLTGLSGSELGVFLSQFKRTFTPEYLTLLSPEELRNLLRAFFKKYSS